MTCDGCGKDVRASYEWTDGELVCEPPDVETCRYCEKRLCGPCFMRHECYGHPAEIRECPWCGVDIVIGIDPSVSIDRDRYHKRCSEAHDFPKAV